MSTTKSLQETVSSGAVSYIVGVVILSVVCGGLTMAAMPIWDPALLLLWSLALLAGEMMLFRTPTGRGNVSMASTLHLAGVILFPAPILIPAVWISRLVANLAVQKKPWFKSLFNAAQISLAVVAASWIYRFVGGLPSITEGGGFLIALLPAVMTAAIGYYIVNTGLVCGILSLVTPGRFWNIWRENFGYRVEIVSYVALFLLAPVAAITYEGAGPLGLAAFLIPMGFIRDACDRFMELDRTQRALISSERLAAKGEMAASVGHELGNYLAVLSGNLQILQRGGHPSSSKQTEERMEKIFEQVDRMSRLSKGLMSYAQARTQYIPADVGGLIMELMEFLRPQNRFDGIEFSLECDPRVGVVTVDPAQLQQVMMNLLNNAADAIIESGAARKEISVWVRWLAAGNQVELGVRDSGPGIPQDVMNQLFEPAFTTREDGNGFGLYAVHRIIENHRGRIVVENPLDGGALFRIFLPANPGRTRTAA